MKWSIVGLVVAGLAVALCAAVLVGALRADRPSAEGEADEISIVVASENLAAVSVVKTAHVIQRTVRPSEAPKGGLSDPVQVVGRVLVIPMVKGQAFTSQCFAAGGSGVHLASALPEGMRAFNISLTLHGGLQGLIYPGSVVDVLVSLRKPEGRGQRGQVISKTLLQGVSVLAVEHRTVTSESEEDGASSAIAGRLRRLMVTLMLTPSQCQVVQLAQEHGTISLGLRNPLDASAATENPVALGDLSDYWSPSPIRATLEMPDTEEEGGWETIIIRGDAREKHILPLPAGERIEQSE